MNHYAQRLNATYASMWMYAYHMQYACMLEHVGWLHLVNTKFNKLNFIPCKYSLLFWLSMLFYYNEAAFFTHHIKYNAKFNSMQCNTIIYNFICEWHENKNDDTFYLQRKYGYVKKIYWQLLIYSIGLLQKINQPTYRNGWRFMSGILAQLKFRTGCTRYT